MSEELVRPQHVFIVRVWSEAADPGAGEWRGRLEHLPSAGVFYFSSLADLADLIALHLERAEARGPAPWNR